LALDLDGVVKLHHSQQDLEGRATAYHSLVERNPEDPALHYQLALTRLLSGDLDGYGAACAAALRRFAPVGDLWAANRLAYACTYAPIAESDMPALIQMALRSASETAPAFAGAEQRIVGAALYRAGRYQDSLKRFRSIAQGVQAPRMGFAVPDDALQPTRSHG
jgi:hypothetical protein